MTGSPTLSGKKSADGPDRREWFGIAALFATAAYFLGVSWRKWPDPLVDFGRELYTPWRMANGAVMYRDVDDFYGPLSQHLNSVLFMVFGSNLMVLVTANIAVFTAIAACIYLLFRRAWGVRAAFVSTALFIAVFGFSQLATVGNYNFATPYAHEATHGLLACLVLALVLDRWVDRPTALRTLAAGLLFGITAVLKPEIMLAAGFVTGAAFAARILRRQAVAWAHVGTWAAGAAAPTLLFWINFCRFLPAGTALAYSCRAWLSVVGSTRYISDPIQSLALGFDQPWLHLGQHALRTLGALALFGLNAVVASAGSRVGRGWARPASWIVALGVSGAVAWAAVDWLEVGRCLLGLVLVYFVFEVAAAVRAARSAASPDAEIRRLLIAALAAALMARMLLYGRIFQFGFYQAALAALVVAAVLVGEIPRRLPLDRWARTLVLVANLLVLVIGAGKLAYISKRTLALKTYQVGSGPDRFYSYSESIDPTGELVSQVAEQLRESPSGTLLVLPEGEMINYLARMPSTVAPFFFFSAATSGGREKEIVSALNAHPPTYIVVISRKVQEYGLHYYGESYGQGKGIMEWLEAHYEGAYVFGGDPIDPGEKGAAIFTRQQ